MADPSFSMSRNELIIDAMDMLGVAEEGNDLTATEYSRAARRLNAIINDIAPFVDVFTLTEKEHTLTAGTQSYTVGNGLNIDMYRPYELTFARRKNSSTSDETAIFIAGRQEYMELPNKSTQAPPNLVYYHPGTSSGTLYVWPTGDSSWDTLLLTFKTPLNTLDTTSDTLPFPQEWHDTFVWLLSEALAPVYIGNIPQWLMIGARERKERMLAYDTTGNSIFLQPDIRY